MFSNYMHMNFFFAFSPQFIDDKENNEQASTCGKILIFLSWVLVFLTMPFSLLVCFKVSVGLGDLLPRINHLCARQNGFWSWLRVEIIYMSEMMLDFLISSNKKVSFCRQVIHNSWSSSSRARVHRNHSEDECFHSKIIFNLQLLENISRFFYYYTFTIFTKSI